MAIEMWLSFNNREEVLQLPITPYWELNRDTNNKVINVYEVGDMNLPGNSGLATITLSSFFPATGRNYWFSRTGEPAGDPLDAIALIEKWRRSKRPIRLIITDRDVNIAALIESFQYGEQNKGGDIYYSVSLKEYLFPKAPKLSTADATTTTTATPRGGQDLKEWTVKYGDTLTGIALAKWGDASKYTTIIELNKDLIKNANSLKAIAGQVLKLEA